MESRLQRIETEAFLSRNSPVMIAETLLDKIPECQPEEAPPPLLEKREPENNELIEKVKEVQIDSDEHFQSTDHATSPELDRAKEPAESTISIDYAPEFAQNMYRSEETVQSLPRTQNPFSIPNGMTMDNSRISEEIVSVPLDDIQVQEVEPQRTEEDTAVPISDAPLIGAPIRLISFFAKYVSGADLVERDGGRSG
ncbi:uncharacterized protein LOC109828176 [Asparagus officinalis]|nr:uncharacterized protein LOC109828176 [Asparagus officinalis]XP_020250794.1 uncharacterized protein LOC109828176 [Asparagus officinalis]